MGKITENKERRRLMESMGPNRGRLKSIFFKLLLFWIGMGILWLFLVSMAVPAWENYRKGAGDPNPRRIMGKIDAAQAIYLERSGKFRFGTMKELRAAGYLKEEFDRGEFNGYHYEIGFDSPKKQEYWVKGTPLKSAQHNYYFFSSSKMGWYGRSSSTDFRVNRREASVGTDFTHFGNH